MPDDQTDRTIRELQALAEAAADSVPRPLDLAAHEAALAREAEAEMDARQPTPDDGSIDWERIRRMAERHRRPWQPPAPRFGSTLIGREASKPRR
jgi:hypothetical protein